MHASCAVCESPCTSHLVGRSSLTHWQFFAVSSFLCQVESSAQADGGAGSAGSAGGSDTGGGVCALIDASIRAARSIIDHTGKRRNHRRDLG